MSERAKEVNVSLWQGRCNVVWVSERVRTTTTTGNIYILAQTTTNLYKDEYQRSEGAKTTANGSIEGRICVVRM